MADHTVRDIAALEALYGTPGKASLIKVRDRLTPTYRAWIMASRLCVVSTIGPNGTDGSPRGDDGPVVQELDPQTVLMPDWRGNNRMDTLRNIVADGRISLMFMVPGSNNVVRVNGIDAGEMYPVSVVWESKDVDRVRVVVDYENEVPEANDDDNSAEHAVTIAYGQYLGWFDSVREQPLAWMFAILSIMTLAVVFTVATRTSIDYGEGAFADDEADWEDDDEDDEDDFDEDDD